MTENTQEPSIDEILTLQEAATFLRISKPQLVVLINSGKLPVIRLGVSNRSARFIRSHLLAWLNENSGPSKSTYKRKPKAVAKAALKSRAILPNSKVPGSAAAKAIAGN